MTAGIIALSLWYSVGVGVSTCFSACTIIIVTCTVNCVCVLQFASVLHDIVYCGSIIKSTLEAAKRKGLGTSNYVCIILKEESLGTTNSLKSNFTGKVWGYEVVKLCM